MKVICNKDKSHIWGYTCVILTQCKVLVLPSVPHLNYFTKRPWSMVLIKRKYEHIKIKDKYYNLLHYFVSEKLCDRSKTVTYVWLVHIYMEYRHILVENLKLLCEPSDRKMFVWGGLLERENIKDFWLKYSKVKRSWLNWNFILSP